MGRADEMLVRQALRATRIDGALFEDDYDDDEYAVGLKVLAYWDEDDEWYDATIQDVGEDWIVVYFDEFDYSTELPFDDDHVVPHPDPPADERGGGGGASTRRPHRAARIPPPPASAPHRAAREALPVFQHRAELLAAIDANQVVVIEGETGCGKSTQVPQFVLEDAAQHGKPCSIIVSQPRRISALGVSERVAAERGEAVGGVVGYSIRLESKSTAATALLFCTTGILTRRLEEDTELEGVTHLFVDEVHERSMESDFLLMVLRDLLSRRPDLTLVLMSATLDANLFSRYFTAKAAPRGSPRPTPPPTVRVPGRTFPVTCLYLEDAIELTGHKLDYEQINYELVVALLQWLRGITGPHVLAEWAQARQTAATLKQPPPPPPRTLAPTQSARGEGNGGSQGGGREVPPPAGPAEEEKRLDIHDGQAYTRAEFLEEYGGTREWDMAKPAAPPKPPKAKSKPKANGADGEQADGSSLADAVLVFLPGFKEITTLHELLLGTKEFGSEPQRSWVLPLHSLLPPEEQRKVFDRPPPGVRKVVLATNIAETAITVDDCSYVIDTGRMKEKRFDPQRRMESLDDVAVSRANAKQRRGRAGRCQPGVAFHLLTRHAHDEVCETAQAPEIKRVPLERLVLTIKALGYVPPAAAVCAQLLDPPEPSAVLQAVRELAGMEAIDLSGGKEELTALGSHLSCLPTDVRIGKFILLCAIFDVVDAGLTIAAILGTRSPFVAPFDKRDAADAAKRSFATGQSDHLAALAAYQLYDSTVGQVKYEFAREHFLGIKTLQTIGSLKRQLLELLSEAGFVREVGAKEPVPVSLHPSSVNARETCFESKYLIYAEMIRTTQIYVRDSSPVSPYALMLFGGGLAAERGGGSTPRADEVAVLAVDSWIRFRVPNRVERLILDVRSKLSSLLMRKIEKPELEFSSAGKGILNAVTALLAAPPPDL